MVALRVASQQEFREGWKEKHSNSTLVVRSNILNRLSAAFPGHLPVGPESVGASEQARAVGSVLAKAVAFASVSSVFVIRQ